MPHNRNLNIMRIMYMPDHTDVRQHVRDESVIGFADDYDGVQP